MKELKKISKRDLAEEILELNLLNDKLYKKGIALTKELNDLKAKHRQDVTAMQCVNDLLATRLEAIEDAVNIEIRQIILLEDKKVTIVLFADGSKTAAKCMDGDTYSPQTGIFVCILKKIFGNRFTRFIQDTEKRISSGEDDFVKIIRKENFSTEVDENKNAKDIKPTGDTKPVDTLTEKIAKKTNKKNG